MTKTTINKIDIMIRKYYEWLESVNDLEKETGITIDTINKINLNKSTVEITEDVCKKMLSCEKDAGRST